jgi:catechol 2,3-dioxygenase-like lactoylglutathione lyase family enzyme
MSNNFSVHGLNHIAWKCRSAEETRAFYEGILGLPLAHVVKADVVPSTGEKLDYVHIFFKMRDNSFVAFFDIGDGKASSNDVDTPNWTNHLALDVGSMDELVAARSRLIDAGVEVTDVIDHHWLQSIYFHDPNGIRLELSYRSIGPEFFESHAKTPHEVLSEWTARASA